jgi:glycosyltransferase involved in cell wall biosynthesis
MSYKGTFKEAKMIVNKDGSMHLVLPEESEQDLIQKLPPVSIITITRNRGVFIGMMLNNWLNIKYPRDKLEWVILDDSDNTDYPLSDYIPQDDPYIKYVKLNTRHRVDDKRNMAVKMAKYEYIVHMDDDDYYFPDHVLVKMRLLLYYKVQGVHSIPIGVYDMMQKSSYILGVPKGLNNTNAVAEATLAYRKDYWQKHPFKGEGEWGLSEGGAFIGKNFDKWLNVHFMFNMISITHSKNITGDARRFINENKDKVKTGNFEDIFPEDFKHQMANVYKLLNQNN